MTDNGTLLSRLAKKNEARTVHCTDKNTVYEKKYLAVSFCSVSKLNRQTAGMYHIFRIFLKNPM